MVLHSHSTTNPLRRSHAPVLVERCSSGDLSTASEPADSEISRPYGSSSQQHEGTYRWGVVTSGHVDVVGAVNVALGDELPSTADAEVAGGFQLALNGFPEGTVVRNCGAKVCYS